MKTNANNEKAFTLIELLVVISIIALLMSIVAPALRKAKGSAMRAVCTNNLHQIALASVAYSVENKEFFPVPASGHMVDVGYGSQDVGQSWPMWVYGGNKGVIWEPGRAFPPEERALAPYIPVNGKTYLCPGDRQTRPDDRGGRLSSWEYMGLSYEMNITTYNNQTTYGQTYQSLYRVKTSKIKGAGQTVLIGEEGAAACWMNPLRPIRDWNEYFIWHGDIIRSEDNVVFKFKSNIGYVDGHVGYTELIVGRVEAPGYTWNP